MPTHVRECHSPCHSSRAELPRACATITTRDDMGRRKQPAKKQQPITASLSTWSSSSRSRRTSRTRPMSSSTFRARYSALGFKIVAGMHTRSFALKFAPLQARSLGSRSLACPREHSFVHLRACSLIRTWTPTASACSSWWASTRKVQALRHGNKGALLPTVPRQGRRAVRS